MLKKNELRNPASCLNKASCDEPVFVLRAKDPLAPMAIRHWVTMSEGNHSKEKLEEAMQLACEMEEWNKMNIPQVCASLQPENRLPMQRFAKKRMQSAEATNAT